MKRAKALGLSALLHMSTLGAASVTWLVGVAPVSEPPVVIRFFSALPPASRVEPFRPIEEEPPPPVAEPEAPVPDAQRVPAPQPTADPGLLSEPLTAPIAPLEPIGSLRPSIPAAPATIRAREFDPPLPPAMAFPRAAAPHGTLSPGSVDAFTPRAGARGYGDTPGPEVPKGDLAERRPGTQAASIDGWGKALGRVPVTVQPLSAVGGDGAARPHVPATDEPKETGDEQADFLGRRYSVHLVDARRLGRSTHDGWRYNEILPLLSEAYRRVAPLGDSITGGGALDGDLETVRVDPDGIEIVYHDGTRHVVVPTRDGLVALYVATGPEAHSKVEEAQRALAALRRLLSEGARS